MVRTVAGVKSKHWADINVQVKEAFNPYSVVELTGGEVRPRTYERHKFKYQGWRAEDSRRGGRSLPGHGQWWPPGEGGEHVTYLDQIFHNFQWQHNKWSLHDIIESPTTPQVGVSDGNDEATVFIEINLQPYMAYLSRSVIIIILLNYSIIEGFAILHI